MNDSQATIQQIEATNKVYTLRANVPNDNELSKLLNISKVTLYTRLRHSLWTDTEIVFIEYLSNKEVKALIDSLDILNK